MLLVQILQGFPRNVPQASRLIERERLDAVINLDVPFATIQERLGGRWTHLPSGRVYNDGFNPPRIAVSVGFLFYLFILQIIPLSAIIMLSCMIF